MTVQAGTRLGPYSILGSLGAGGMGEVYRARDTTLNRDVAIKVLPELFSRDPDRRARFEREAQAVAALSHPNVLAIYEFGTSGETSYAAIELLDGETLRDRIDRGPQAARRAVDICAQIARGLAAAHEKGIVHRDVKPENVFVTREGRVKILDFGLASQRVPSGISADLTMPPTDAGTVLGTVGYMAPEQVRGLPADARSDIFALGATLYELVSGRGAFHRESAAETMSAIAREDPAPMSSTAAAALSPTVERIIWRCLEKDPAARFQSCHDLAFALENASVDSGTASAGGVTVPSWRSRWWPAAAWIAVGGIAGAALAGLAFKPDPVGVSSGPVATYDIQMPARTQLQRVEGHPIVAASPDGSAVVFVGVSRGVSRLYSRRSRDAEAHPIAGTEGAEDPVFSPDGGSIAFISNADLKKVSVDGGVTMLSAGTITDDARGLTWISQDEIVFAPDPIRGLFRISGDGGTPGVLTEPDVAKGERTHRWPAKIIGRNAVLFTVGSMNSPDDYEGARIDALDLDSGQRVTVLQGASMARHTPDGRLVFARGGALHSVAFDAAGLQTSGPVSSVQAGVSTDFTSGAANFAFGLNGTLAYVHSATSDNQRRLYWLDRDDARPALDLPPAVYNDLSFSPDGSKLALVIGPVGSGDVYIHDLERKTMVRLTFDGRSASPIWSPDGRDVYYAHRPLEPGFVSHVMRKPADGSREAERLQTVDSRLYLGYLADPDTLVCFVPDRPGPPMRRSDIVQLRLGSSDPPVPLVATPGQDYGPALSPDRRYLAHVSDSAGRPEIFVRALSGLGAQWQVSLDGGEEPRWSPDGRQLFYRGGSRLMAADVDLRPTFRSSAPRVLFDQVYNLRVESGNSYAVNPKTGRFISIGLSDTDGVTSPPTLRVVLNWFSGR